MIQRIENKKENDIIVPGQQTDVRWTEPKSTDDNGWLKNIKKAQEP